MANYNATTDILRVAQVRINTGGGVETALDSEYVRNIALEAQASVQTLVDSESARVDTIGRRLNILEGYRLPDYDSDLRVANTGITAMQASIVVERGRIDSVDSRLTTAEADIVTLETTVGTATLTTTATAIKEAINELDAEIGSTAMGTTATEVKAAIAELKGLIDTLTTRVTALESDRDDLQSRVGATAVAFALDDLADVNASSPAVGQTITWNGTNWINAAN